MAEHMAERERRARVPKPTVDPTPTERESSVPAGAEGVFETQRDGEKGRQVPPDAVPESPATSDATTEGASFRHAREGVRVWLHETFPGHENAVIWGFVGFLVALLFFIIGFWRTLLVVLLVAVGVAFGQVLDGDPKIINALRGLFRGDNGR